MAETKFNNIHIKRLGWAALVSLAAIAQLSAGNMAAAIATHISTTSTSNKSFIRVRPDRSSQLAQAQAQAQAQATDTGCRLTNNSLGIYEEPDMSSQPLGVLEVAQAVRLGIVGGRNSIDGWSYIIDPSPGWIRARYLTTCPPEAEATLKPIAPIAASSPSPTISASPTPTTPPPAGRIAQPPPQATATTTTRRAIATSPTPQDMTRDRTNSATANRISQTPPRTAADAPPVTPVSTPPLRPPSVQQANLPRLACEVLPADGLVLRSQPTLTGDSYLDTIPPGAHEFQFTRNTVSENGRRWVYITAPAEGWVLLNLQDGSSTIGGDRCG